MAVPTPFNARAPNAPPFGRPRPKRGAALRTVHLRAGDTVVVIGCGGEYVFECVGLVPTAEQAVQMTARGGTTVLVGIVPVTDTIAVSAAHLALQEKKITGSLMGSNCFHYDLPRYVDFYLDGRLRLDEMISSRITLKEVNSAVDAMRKGEAARLCPLSRPMHCPILSSFFGARRCRRSRPGRRCASV